VDRSFVRDIATDRTTRPQVISSSASPTACLKVIAEIETEQLAYLRERLPTPVAGPATSSRPVPAEELSALEGTSRCRNFPYEG